MRITHKVEITETDEYSFFKTLPYNRDVSRAKVDKIKKSIEEGNLSFLYPILCLEDGHIFDGQHRFTALVELRLPIFYREIDGEDVDIHDLIRVNHNNFPFNLEAFLKCYQETGNTDYLRFKNDVFGLGFPPSTILLILYGHTNTTKIKDGTFKYTTNDTKKLLEFFGKLECCHIYPFHRQHRFVRGFKFLLTRNGYSHDLFMTQIKKYSHLIPKSQILTSWDALYRQLLEVYNYRLKDEFKIKYNQQDIDAEKKS